jgi:hypothetical protein
VVFLAGVSAVTALGVSSGLAWWTVWFVFAIIGTLIFLLATDQLEGYRMAVRPPLTHTSTGCACARA